MKNKIELENESGNEETEENHMALGICFGMFAGTVGMCILASFGQIAWGGLSLGLGLMIGLIIGICV